MKTLTTILFLFLILTLTGCNFPTPTSAYKGTLHLEHTLAQSETTVPEPSQHGITLTESPRDFTIIPTVNIPTPTSTPDPFVNLYDCQMVIQFLSGPLENKGTEFQVLGRDYFWDKGDKFEIGKGSGVYYESQHYFILHSSFLNGNIFRDMEAEFLRRYLENWGWVDTQYIQEKIDGLIGSEVVWVCNGEALFSSYIDGVVRLSHEASNRLWLEPRNIADILQSREGDASEWIGEIPEFSQDQILLGFCGWGPFTLGEERFTYYRYLVSFDVLEHYQ
jgi:hypothetical protein